MFKMSLLEMKHFLIVTDASFIIFFFDLEYSSGEEYDTTIW